MQLIQIMSQIILNGIESALDPGNTELRQVIILNGIESNDRGLLEALRVLLIILNGIESFPYEYLT